MSFSTIFFNFDTLSLFSQWIVALTVPYVPDEYELLLITPYHGLIKNLLITIFAFNKHFNPTGPHIRFFTKKTLLDLLSKNKLKTVKIGYYGRIYPIPHSIYVLAQKIK